MGIGLKGGRRRRRRRSTFSQVHNAAAVENWKVSAARLFFTLNQSCYATRIVPRPAVLYRQLSSTTHVHPFINRRTQTQTRAS